MNDSIIKKSRKAKEIASVLLAMVCVGNIATVSKSDAAAPAHVALARAAAGSDEEKLIFAARNGNLNEVNRLLAIPGINVDAANTGYTALHLAAQFGHAEIVHTLLEAGANANAVNIINNETPLHIAARNGHVNVAQVLLSEAQQLLDVNARNEDGNTPLHLAVQHVSREVVIQLLRLVVLQLQGRLRGVQRINVNARNNDGMTPLDLARAGENIWMTLRSDSIADRRQTLGARAQAGDICGAFEDESASIIDMLIVAGAQ